MSTLRRLFQHSRLAILVVLCVAALTATSVFASGPASPSFATTVYGNPDAAVNGKLAVGSATVGSKSLTVSGVIDFVGAGTVHNYFSQGPGNNMQINSNVDEFNGVGNSSNSQWKMVLGSSLDQFSIRRSPSGGTYNEDALFFINGDTGDVGIATVDTGNNASIPFTPQAKLHVQSGSGTAIMAENTSTVGGLAGQFTGNVNVDGGVTVSRSGGSSIFTENTDTGGVALTAENVSTSGALAAQFNGNVNIDGNLAVTGSVSKAGGSFRIDDPLDSTKYLQHSFVESPDMKNIYDGVVTLDDNGQAVVTMPDWFQALNQDFRYQLTAIGQSAPDLYVSSKMDGNQFEIAGGSPGMDVSWQVTGIRHDPWAEANRIQVLVDK
jgi:hypothetical protein